MARVAVAQMTSTDDVQANIAAVRELCEQAQHQQARLLVLPENFACMGKSIRTLCDIAEDEGVGPIQEALSQLASTFKLWIVAGTIPLKVPNGRVWASSLVYDDKGERQARYDKIHLFDVEVSPDETHRESEAIAPGCQPTLVNTPVGKLGPSVCYDVRFPELYRFLVCEGAELFTVVAAFTKKTGSAHWHTLLRARAIENMCYILASNQTGVHASGRETYGHSLIIDPWGDIIAEIKEGTGIICADIDLKNLYARRKSFPCLNHRVL